jgi:predicted 3-demethylubiquinone-9 3-methyltransferase (glyoxalase superfamily)
VPDVIPHLRYADKAEEAAAFYVSLLPDSRIDSVTALPADSPSGPAGSVKVVEFTLQGRPFLAINAGPSIHSTTPSASSSRAPTRSRSIGCGRRYQMGTRSNNPAG